MLRPLSGSGSARPRGDHGSATVEVAIVLPVALVLLLLVVQAGLYFHTQAAATLAARKAVEVARRPSDGRSPPSDTLQHNAAAQMEAEAFLRQSAGALLEPRVLTWRDTRTATVEVDGHVASVLFGVRLPLHVVVHAPVEAVTP